MSAASGVRRRVLNVALTAAFGAATLVSGASRAVATPATTIEVFPGPNAISDALAIAQSGDKLNIHAGTYNEHFSIPTPGLTLQAAGDGPVVVDGGCAGTWTIQITKSGTLVSDLTVKGGTFGEITFSGVSSGKVVSSTVTDTCGDAEYGINVFQSSYIRVLGNTASGFGDAGIYIGAINSGGNTLIKGNESFGNNRGIIVENTDGARVVVVGNTTHDNSTTGIWITNSSGIAVRSNTVSDNSFTGIQTDSLAGGNLITLNTVSGHQYDLANDGTMVNCWIDNVYTTSRGTISC